jgi:hypothetical protein
LAETRSIFTVKVTLHLLGELAKPRPSPRHCKSERLPGAQCRTFANLRDIAGNAAASRSRIFPAVGDFS